MERVKEESSYILESNRKVGVCVWMMTEPFGLSQPTFNQEVHVWETLFPYVSHTKTAIEKSDSRWVLCIR